MLTSAKLREIYISASNLFIHKGYRQTQMTDIAKDVKLATGSFYNYFTGKRAIFDFTLRCIFDDEYLGSEIVFPIDEIPHPELIERYIDQAFDDFLNKTERVEGSTYEGILSDLYDFIAKYWRGISIFERNEVNWPELAGLFFKKRQALFDVLTEYLEEAVRMGELREIQSIECHARLIIEVLAWWGMHRRFDRSHSTIDDETAKKVAMDALIHAYKSKV